MVVLDETRADVLPQPPDAYWSRRADITSHAAGLDAPPEDIAYTAAEHEVWSIVAAALGANWHSHAAADVIAARDALALPSDRVPQLSEVSRTLRPLTGFDYRAVEGLIPSADFFASLANSTFPSTQYLRWEGAPLYTPEPDVIHEVLGHANCLACPQIAELHRLAGVAIGRIETELARQWVNAVFWFTVEFGVLGEPERRRAPKAYGAGLLSSPGELGWFADHAELRPLDLVDMATVGYDIDHYQPVLFAGHSMDHVLDVVGGFFDSVTDALAHRSLPHRAQENG